MMGPSGKCPGKKLSLTVGVPTLYQHSTSTVTVHISTVPVAYLDHEHPGHDGSLGKCPGKKLSLTVGVPTLYQHSTSTVTVRISTVPVAYLDHEHPGHDGSWEVPREEVVVDGGRTNTVPAQYQYSNSTYQHCTEWRTSTMSTPGMMGLSGSAPGRSCH